MKKIIAVTLVAIMTIAIGAGALAEISRDDARQIALEKAGLTEDAVQFTECHKDFEDGRQIWEVEFRSGMTEYEFDIDAGSGRILDMDIDRID